MSTTGCGRFLFVVPPLAGHVNPAACVAAELQRHGHEVAWVAHEAVVGEHLGPAAAAVYPAGGAFLDDVVHHLPERARLRGPSALTYLWDRVLVPLALDMADPVRAAIDHFQPDVVVADQQAFAGSIVAAELGLPWAVSAATTADLGGPPLEMLPKVGEWMRRQVASLCEEIGVNGLGSAGFDPRYSPHLMLVYSSRALVGETGDDELPLAFVGPVVRSSSGPARHACPGADQTFPWEWLERYDLNVLVSLGTVNDDVGERFLWRAIDAVAGNQGAAPSGRPRYGAVVVGPARLQAAASSVDNVLVRERVPQVDLLGHLDAVVCHAGHNTTTEALAAGLPLVCAPIRDDQPVVAAQVVRAGAGVRLGFGRARPQHIAAAIATVLDDPSYRMAALEIAESFRAAGGSAAAVRHLESLVVRHGASTAR